jgi:hypothetical protein
VRVSLSHRLPSNRSPAGATISFAARFYDDSSEPWTLSAPSTARYRVYDAERGCDVIAWTTITPATTASISLPGTSLESECPRRLTLIVEANTDLSTQYQASKRFLIDPLPAQ